MALAQEIPSLTTEMRACVAAVLGKSAIDEAITQTVLQALSVAATLWQMLHYQRGR